MSKSKIHKGGGFLGYTPSQTRAGKAGKISKKENGPFAEAKPCWRPESSQKNTPEMGGGGEILQKKHPTGFFLT